MAYHDSLTTARLPRQSERAAVATTVAAATPAPPLAGGPGAGFWAALGLGIPLALLAGWWLGHLDPAGLAARLIPATERGAWYLTRAAGTVAYLLLTGSTIWGLILSSRVVADRVPPPLALALHNSLAWLAIGFASFHALVLLGDGYYTYRLADILIPFVGPYRPGWVGLGTLGLYGAIIISASFGLRRWIGQRHWRRLHMLTFAVYALVTLHGFAAGTDTANPGARAIYLAGALAVIFLVNYRLLTARRDRKQRATAAR
ncbi:MAG: ferric reductase-like transmembrane domain-containing protein [Caldilineaceae bacterium]|nr:ferric reductase-like transmembrane domain-containing protein [Caldilineaceae bacterium]